MAMTPFQRAAAVYWLQHGFWSPELPDRLLSKLDSWAFRVEEAGPNTMAALRVEAGLHPIAGLDVDELAPLDAELC